MHGWRLPGFKAKQLLSLRCAPHCSIPPLWCWQRIRVRKERQRASMPQCYWFILISSSLNLVSLQHKYIILCLIFHWSLNDSYSAGFREKWLLPLDWQSNANVSHIGLRGGCHKWAMSGVIKRERKTGQWKSMEERWNSPPFRGRQKSVCGGVRWRGRWEYGGTVDVRKSEREGKR